MTPVLFSLNQKITSPQRKHGAHIFWRKKTNVLYFYFADLNYDSIKNSSDTFAPLLLQLKLSILNFFLVFLFVYSNPFFTELIFYLCAIPSNCSHNFPTLSPLIYYFGVVYFTPTSNVSQIFMNFSPFNLILRLPGE